MVDRMDQGMIPKHLKITSYEDMWGHVSRALFQTHVESRLKTEIIEEPEKYVEVDPEMALTLLDMVDAGKILLLITNSDWTYTEKMMSFAYDRCVLILRCLKCSCTFPMIRVASTNCRLGKHARALLVRHSFISCFTNCTFFLSQWNMKPQLHSMHGTPSFLKAYAFLYVVTSGWLPFLVFKVWMTCIFATSDVLCSFWDGLLLPRQW